MESGDFEWCARFAKKNYSASIGLAKIPPTPSGSAESCSKQSAVDVPIIRRGIAHLSSLVAIYTCIYILQWGTHAEQITDEKATATKKAFPQLNATKTTYTLIISRYLNPS
jgi:hypothetical protein